MKRGFPMTVKPFRGVRPDKRFAAILNVPPYDVVDAQEVQKSASNNNYSYFHITRAEVDLPGLKDEHSEAVYKKARENFLRFISDGVLKTDEKPCYYMLAQTWEGRTQNGIYAAVSCEEYDRGLIKKHELTRKDKEQDRTNHIRTVGADTGPVFLAFENTPDYAAIKDAVQINDPEYDITDENGVQNRLWVVSDAATVDQIEKYFQSIPALYIADGHHRAASAGNVWREGGKSLPGCDYFMAVIFPSSELQILPYNRVVTDLNGLSEAAFIDQIKTKFSIKETGQLLPEGKGEIIMYLAKKLYSLTPKTGTFNTADPQEALDVSILQNNLLSPVLGISDPRTSQRIKFVGGIKGPKVLMSMVDNGSAAVSFCLFPVSMKELMDVTNRGQIMPPKSTWFEPKLRDGLVTYRIDQ